MRNVILPIIITFGALTVLPGCFDGFGLRGSGEVITVQRDTRPFDKVTLNGKGELFITQDDETSLRIEAEDNIIEVMYTKFDDGELEIGFDERLGKTKPIRIFLSSPNYREIHVNGAGNIRGNTVIKGSKLDLSVSGAGEIEAEVDVKLLNCDISGAGDAELTGRAFEHDFSISGAGDLEAYGLITDKTKIDISGAGNAKVNVSDHLSVEISGAGGVYYKGNPNTIDKDVSGAGTLKPAN